MISRHIALCIWILGFWTTQLPAQLTDVLTFEFDLSKPLKAGETVRIEGKLPPFFMGQQELLSIQTTAGVVDTLLPPGDERFILTYTATETHRPPPIHVKLGLQILEHDLAGVALGAASATARTSYERLQAFAKTLDQQAANYDSLKTTMRKRRGLKLNDRQLMLDLAELAARDQGLRFQRVGGYLLNDAPYATVWLEVEDPVFGSVMFDPYVSYFTQGEFPAANLPSSYLKLTDAPNILPDQALPWIYQVASTRKSPPKVSRAILGAPLFPLQLEALRAAYDSEEDNTERERATLMLSTYPNNAIVLIYAGMIEARSGNHALARNLLQLAIANSATQEERSNAYYAFGNALALSGYAKESVRYLRAALEEGLAISNETITDDVDLKPLTSYPPFVELLAAHANGDFDSYLAPE